MEQQLYQFEKAFFPNLHAGRATSSLVHNYSNAVQETNQHEINRALAYERLRKQLRFTKIAEFGHAQVKPEKKQRRFPKRLEKPKKKHSSSVTTTLLRPSEYTGCMMENSCQDVKFGDVTDIEQKSGQSIPGNLEE